MSSNYRKNGIKLFSIGLLAAVSVTAAAVTAVYAAESDQRLRVKGSVLMANGVDDLAKEFEKQYPGNIIVVSGGGTNKGFADFVEKNVELVMATRLMNDEESKAAALKNIKPVNRVITWGCITIIVHPDNPVKDMSLEQVKDVFTGQTKSWSQLGGPDAPIEVLLPDPAKHGTNQFFSTNVMNGLPFGSGSKIKPDYARIIRDIGSNKGAVAFCVLSKALGAGNQIKILPIKRSADSAAVAPSVQTAADKSYPISRPLYFFWDGNAETPLLKNFVTFCEKTGLKLR